MRESVVEAHLVKRVEETGGLVRKIKYIGRRSCPDRLVGWPLRPGVDIYWADGGLAQLNICPARNTLVETKRPKGKARADQEREHERLRAVGFDVRLLDTIEAVDKFVEEMTR